MIARINSLKSGGIVLILCAFLAGAGVSGLWLYSDRAWAEHQSRASTMGQLLYGSLIQSVPFAEELTAITLPPYAQALADKGQFERISELPKPAFVTYLSIGAASDPALTRPVIQPVLQIALISPKLHYPLSELDLRQAASPQERMGRVVELLATYCSDAVILAHTATTGWQQISGPEIWSCAAQPADYRLLAVALSVIALITFSSFIIGASTQFSAFAEQLSANKRLGGRAPYPATGPEELRRIIDAFNDFRELERKHLSDRALVLSGVTHDLGTPAQRLKLRATLIEDTDLREKLVADIDQMTGIIESVLAYTRAELSTEDARNLSLTSLVEAVVADFTDINQPVSLLSSEAVMVEGGQSIFMSRRGRSAFHEQTAIIVMARPVALRRALSNLIDNALKYGRRAGIRIETDSKAAHILVEDSGGTNAVETLEAMTRPFSRGENAAPVDGYGMGLTIASAVALEHGGSLSFRPGQEGSVAVLSIPR